MTKIYLMKDVLSGMYKIGRSDSPTRRERTLLAQSPSIHLIWYWLECEESEEKRLHKRFSKQRQRGEWFELNTHHLADLECAMRKYRRMLATGYYQVWDASTRHTIADAAFCLTATSSILQYSLDDVVY